MVARPPWPLPTPLQVAATGIAAGRAPDMVLLRSLASDLGVDWGDMRQLLDRVDENATAESLRRLLLEFGALLVLAAVGKGGRSVGPGGSHAG